MGSSQSSPSIVLLIDEPGKDCKRAGREMVKKKGRRKNKKKLGWEKRTNTLIALTSIMASKIFETKIKRQIAGQVRHLLSPLSSYTTTLDPS
jgi:hypothetical protein